MNPDFIELLQLNDATFPIGNYTFSWGMETFIQQGLIKDENSLKDYLQSEMEMSFLYGEILAVMLSYNNCNNNKYLETIDEIYSASKSSFEIRDASRKLATRFNKTVSNFYDSSKLFPAQSFCIAYGSYCGKKSFSIEDTLTTFIYSQLSARVTTAVKLIPLSQNIGQKLLNELLQNIPDLIKQVKELTIDELCQSCPSLEIRSMQHEYLYTRLYSN